MQDAAKVHCSVIKDGHVCFIRGEYNESARRGNTYITSFHRDPDWTRTDVTFHARCWHPEQIEAVVADAGFDSCEQHNSDAADWLRNALGPARSCFVARRAA